jgi:hypothetical protein
MFTLIALLLVASVMAEVKSSRRGKSSGKSASSEATRVKNIVEHTSDKRPLPFQYYDGRSSSEYDTSTSDSNPSGTGHLNDSPYYIARMAGIKVHHFLRKNLNMTHVLCDRFEVSTAFNAACNAFIFNAVRDVVTKGELSDHITLVAGASTKFRSLPSESARERLCGPVARGEVNNCEARFWVEPKKETAVSTFLINTAWEAKKACHHTVHTVDDRCKNKVECLLLETLTVSYPEIVALKACSEDDLNKISINEKKRPGAKKNDD